MGGFGFATFGSGTKPDGDSLSVVSGATHGIGKFN